jgi:phosphoribosylanthranilate isomerase
VSATTAGEGAATPVRVKICGVTSVADARAAVAAGADMIGLNFYPGSKRFITLERAQEIVAALPDHVWKVGVFVNAPRAEIERVRAGARLDAIQLHGDEPAEMTQGFSVPVVRTLKLCAAGDAQRALAQVCADYYLCEGDAGAAFGGAGASFDWEWAREVPRQRLVVAGGLTPENVAAAVRALRPFAVDVASGVESAPGVKDPARMAALVAHAKAA